MGAPRIDDVARPVIGRFYMVPCQETWQPFGWPRFTPIIGPRHRDVEHLEFEPEHFHVDWRFVPEWFYVEQTKRRSGSPLSQVFTSSNGRMVLGETVMRRLKMKRDMPTFPRVIDIGKASGVKWQRLERAHAMCLLKPGLICPHRGIPLEQFVQPDGTVVCPGHGLKWDARNGTLLPYQDTQIQLGLPL